MNEDGGYECLHGYFMWRDSESSASPTGSSCQTTSADSEVADASA
jgi:hypothetical protein